jgi:hypothetical protein
MRRFGFSLIFVNFVVRHKLIDGMPLIGYVSRREKRSDGTIPVHVAQARNSRSAAGHDRAPLRCRVKSYSKGPLAAN